MEKKRVGLFIDKSLAENKCRGGGSHSSESGVDVGLKVALHVLLQTLGMGDSSSLLGANSMNVSSVLSTFNDSIGKNICAYAHSFIIGVNSNKYTFARTLRRSL